MGQLFRAEQSRIEWIDLCRGIGIILVLLGHCSPPLNTFIYGFHMPLFVILSGYLYKKQESINKATLKNFKRYVLPYFLLCLINLILNTVIEMVKGEGGSNVGRYILGIIYSRGNSIWMPNCSPLWFLTAIFMALFFYEMLNHFIKNNILRMVTIGFLVIFSYCLSLANVHKLPWNIDTALIMLCFLALGNGLKKVKFNGWIALITLVIGVTSIYCNRTFVNFDDHVYGNIFLMIVGALFVSYSIMTLCKLVSDKQRIKVIEYYGKNTIFLMGFDYFVGGLCRDFLNCLGIDHWLILFVCKLILITILLQIWLLIVNQITNTRIREIFKI